MRMEGDDTAIELRTRRNVARSGEVVRNYAPLMVALRLYRERGLLAARQLKRLAEQMHAVSMESMERRVSGARVRGVGSVLAAGAGVAGFFLAGPAIVGAVLAGSAIGVGGQVAISVSDNKQKNEEQGLLKRTEVIYKEFEEEMTRVRETICRLFNIQEDSIRLLDSMLESITSDIEYVGVDVPDLRMLESVVSNLRVLQDQLSLDQQQEMSAMVGTLWHFVSPCLAGLWEGSDILQGGCDHSFFSRCTSTPQSSSNFRCFSVAGKALHTLGLVVNIANMTVSSWEVHTLNNKLKDMQGMKEDEQIRYLGGVADQLMNKAVNMESTIIAIFQDNFS